MPPKRQICNILVSDSLPFHQCCALFRLKLFNISLCSCAQVNFTVT